MKELCFAGSGGLYPYYLGIAHFIKNNYNLDDVIFTGLSGGCFSVIPLALDMDMDIYINDYHKSFIEDVSSCGYGGLYNLISICRKRLLEYLPDELDKINNKLNIHITEIPNMLNPFSWKHEVISEWESIEDFVDCVMCSMYIPIYGKKPLYHYRGKYYIDGGALKYIDKNYKFNTGKCDKFMVISTNMWRDLEKEHRWYICNTNEEFSKKLIKWGIEDCQKNKAELDSFFLN